jgi:antitoxin component of MazEF toxin-antitoxin module
MTTLIEVKEPSTINKYVARIFRNGNSFGVRIPASIAEQYNMNKPGYALIQANGDCLRVKQINEENLN